MDGFLTSPFITKFPKNLKRTVFSGNGSYYDLFKAIKLGNFVAGMNGESFVDLLSELRVAEPELFKQFSSLEASGKLQAKDTDQEIHESLKNIKIRKGILKEISQGYSQTSQSVFHDDVGDSQKKLEIMKAGGKPLIDDKDLNSGLVSYLFDEKSIPLNRGEEFNWSRFLSDYNYPFNRIRILDPYLYTNVKDIDLNNLLKTLIKQSNPEKLTIEIISDLQPRNSKWTKEEIIEKLRQELNLQKKFKETLTLYHQKGSGSNVFHKRAIWTNFWTLLTDRGFDFLKLQTGKGTVTHENILVLTGKYSSKNSLWHQIDNNWNDYIKISEQVNF